MVGQLTLPEVYNYEILPDVILAPRTDPIYNAHGYLTKVPIDAILPYLDAFTAPGELVVDLFAGSGMTAVAAKIAGRHAKVSDISVLGQHIATGYLADVDHAELRAVARQVVAAARARLGDLYYTEREADKTRCEMIRAIWSFTYRCASCDGEIVYFEAMRLLNWRSPATCPHCDAPFSKRNGVYQRDVPVRVVVPGGNGKQLEQAVSDVDIQNIEKARSRPELQEVPSRAIDPHREMYRRSALKKWHLTETKDFFSARNALALYHLWSEIQNLKSERLRQKLLFAFTAILPRASRRYQWSPQRPLNAATQTYYIAPVYYEWNVFDLFNRKIDAAVRSDQEILSRRSALGARTESRQEYLLASATALTHLRDNSVDYIYTDPPFGSNLFYSDMHLFHEAWLAECTNDREEAVIHTNGDKATGAASRYEELLRAAFTEAFRVLKPGRCMSVVFGNSSGRVWAMVQRILQQSGFDPRPAHIGILDKGQRSVKGLVSGSESVATLDLVLTVRKPDNETKEADPAAQPHSLEEIVDETLRELDYGTRPTPSHVYLIVLKRAFEVGLQVESFHLSDILEKLRERGIRVDPKSGRLQQVEAEVQ